MTAHQEHVSFRLTRELLDRINTVRGALERRSVGLKIEQAKVLRLAIERGLDAIELELSTATDRTEKSRARQKRYREKHAEEISLRNKVQGKRYYAANRDRVIATVKEYAKSNREKINATKRKRDVARPEMVLLKSARNRARRVGVPCTITEVDIRACIPADGLCPIVRTAFERGVGPGGHKPTSMSLDRIIPELGYVPGNIAVISNLANSLKSDCTSPDVFDRLAEYLEGFRTETYGPDDIVVLNSGVEPEKLLLKRAKYRAREKGLSFDLTLDDIRGCIPRSGICPITMEPLQVGVGHTSRGSISLDRILPELGYVKGNVAVISRWANVLKGACTDPSVFRGISRYIRINTPIGVDS